jgi:preprotein translocase subunit SecG
MITFSIVLQFVLTAILTLAVMLQKSSSIGLGAYSGSNESVFGAKGPAGFLTKATFFVGILFIANTVFLTYYFNKEKNSSVVDKVKVLTPTQTGK